jgi:fluoride exporter
MFKLPINSFSHYNSLMSYLIVGLGGFLGAMTRFGFYQLQKSSSLSHWPWATLTVNVIGCFLIGLYFGLNQKSFVNTDSLTLLLVIGFLGSFTTFSAFGLESYKMYLSHNSAQLILNIGLNMGLTLFAVGLGAAIGALKP